MQTKYGFSVGQIVTNKVELEDECGSKISVGTSLKIVDIVPKVRKTHSKLIENFPCTFDSKTYFVNLVRADSGLDFPRIRVNFATIQK